MFGVFKLIVAIGYLLLIGCSQVTSNTPVNLDKFEKSLRPTISVQNRTSPNWTLTDRMDYHNIPGVAVAIIENGTVVFTKGYGVLSVGADAQVTKDTVFSVGSVSKIITAATTLKLTEQGKLDIDRNVDDYLMSWQIPQSKHRGGAPITLRMILSHTAGFSVHGFEDYFPGEAIPSTLDILSGRPPAKSDPVEIVFQPGSRRQYSGGGITVEQLILTDVMKQTFEDVTQMIVLHPLGMNRSTFMNPLPASHGNIAKAHDIEGKAVALPIGWPTMPEKAASGLWTSAHDLSIFVAALLNSHNGEEEFLKNATAKEMMLEVSPSYNGLGPRINRSHSQTSFNHPGANDNYRAWIEGNLETGDGLVVLTNGTNGFSLITEIRNAVADTYGWANNPAVSLDGILLSQSVRAALKQSYILDDSYPTALQKQLSELRSQKDVKGIINDGAFEMKGADYTVILPIYSDKPD